MSHRTYDAALGLAAGVMIGAAVFALILPGLTLGRTQDVLGGFVVGGVGLLLANRLLPHLHLPHRDEPGYPLQPEAPDAATVSSEKRATTSDEPTDLEHDTEAESPEESLRRAVLVGGAVTVHNVPEGLAIGVAFASGEVGVGTALAIAIAIQNVPDGFAVAVPAVDAGVSRVRVLVYTTLSGGVPEPIAAAIGFVLVDAVSGAFPAAAGFAAGAMVAVVLRELVPWSHGHGHADAATLAFLAGFALMIVVEGAL